MKKLFSVLEDALVRGEDTVLVSVVASSGSTPRGAGARMLVSRAGLLAGTIGGGAVEYRCIAMAQALLDGGQPLLQSFQLNQKDTAGLGMVCGGQVQVYFLPIQGGDREVLELCREAVARFGAGTPFWLLTPLQAGGSLTLWPQGGGGRVVPPACVTAELPQEPVVRQAEGGQWFCEQVQRAGTVYIFGGGHVAQALVPVLAPLDFPCVVLEDRPEFAEPRLFPQAREVRCIDLGRISDRVDITKDDYVCIMTRGHQNDLLVQQQVLRTPARYIGLIGSIRKSAASFASLRKMGFSEQDLRRIVTPIGLPIGGRSPAEIAISIAAQLIQCRSGVRDFSGSEGLI